MCEYCVLGEDDPPCECVCSSYMGKKFCKNCMHKISKAYSPRQSG